MIVWGAWAEVCSLACAPHISFSARGCGDVVCVLSASARQWWARSSGSRPRAPTSFGVGFVPLAALYPPGSLYALLARFRALTAPRVRFAPVWPSTGRTVSERGMWWLYVAVAMPLRGVSTFLCWRAKERPWPCVAGALILFAALLARLARVGGSPTPCGFVHSSHGR